MKFLLFFIAVGLTSGILGVIFTPSTSPIKPFSVGVIFFFIVLILPPTIMDIHYKSREKAEGRWVAEIDKPGVKALGYLLGLVLSALLCKLILFLLALFS